MSAWPPVAPADPPLEADADVAVAGELCPLVLASMPVGEATGMPVDEAATGLPAEELGPPTGMAGTLAMTEALADTDALAVREAGIEPVMGDSTMSAQGF